jgi:GTP cyclohydrolase I
MHLHDDPTDIEYSTAMRLQARKVTEEQIHKFEGYTSEIFSAFGLDLNTPATKDTPRRDGLYSLAQNGTSHSLNLLQNADHTFSFYSLEGVYFKVFLRLHR